MRPYLSALGASWPTWCRYLDPVRLSQNVTCHGRKTSAVMDACQGNLNAKRHLTPTQNVTCHGRMRVCTHTALAEVSRWCVHRG